MTKPFWIIQSNLNNADRVLSFIFAEHNIAHAFVEIIPFSEEVPDVEVPDNSFVVVRGSTTMMIGAKKQSWKPGVWHNDNFSPSWYKKSYQEQFLNFHGRSVNIKNIEAVFQELKAEKLFIRADSDYKELSGAVYDLEEALVLQNEILSDKHYFGNDLEVYIAPLVDIQEEYRLIVVNNQVVSGTSYKINGRPTYISAPQDILDFGQSVAHLGPDEVYVLDIGRTGNNSLGVIECNCFNGAGIYGDHETIVLAINKFLSEKGI